MTAVNGNKIVLVVGATIFLFSLRQKKKKKKKKNNNFQGASVYNSLPHIFFSLTESYSSGFDPDHFHFSVFLSPSNRLGNNNNIEKKRKKIREKNTGLKSFHSLKLDWLTFPVIIFLLGIALM